RRDQQRDRCDSSHACCHTSFPQVNGRTVTGVTGVTVTGRTGRGRLQPASPRMTPCLVGMESAADRLASRPPASRDRDRLAAAAKSPRGLYHGYCRGRARPTAPSAASCRVHRRLGGMEGTGRGQRTFSAGLLGLMLATAGLLAIVLLDSRPALAQPADSDLTLTGLGDQPDSDANFQTELQYELG